MRLQTVFCCSYDPWASCMCDSGVENCIGCGRSSEVRLGSSWHHFMHPGESFGHQSVGKWSHNKCGDAHAWPLLEDCLPDPPPHALPSLDAPRWTGPAVVERLCRHTAPKRRHQMLQNLFLGYIKEGMLNTHLLLHYLFLAAQHLLRECLSVRLSAALVSDA